MEHLPVQIGPEIEETYLTAGLDYYKPTMSQLQFEKHPDRMVTFTFKNRGEQRLADYIDADALQEQLDFIRERGWSDSELAYLRNVTDPKGKRVFTDEYLSYLAEHELPRVEVSMDKEKDDIAIVTTGKWPLVTFWETIVMSQVSEMYFARYIQKHNLDMQDIYAEGNRRFDEWTDYLRVNPDVKISEFGTRRHFSLRWQKHILGRLAIECPDNLLGTSNVGLAHTMGLQPIGTFAHEMPMVYAGIAEADGGNDDAIRASHRQMLTDWVDRYPHLDTALADTFGSDFFFEDFGDLSERYRSLRHDSGDPLAFAADAQAFYLSRGTDTRTKSIVFSDSLDVRTVQRIHEAVKEVVRDPYGVGTKLTNNVGLTALNIVMKATDVDGVKLVKLSNDQGKHTGPEAQVERYREIFKAKRKEQ